MHGNPTKDAGPAPATRKLCARLGLEPADFEVLELNEPFASQVLARPRALAAMCIGVGQGIAVAVESV